jgi:hypothetical protein
MTLINGCVRPIAAAGTTGEPLYYFSITREAIEKRPFRRGTIYFLPRDSFEQQPAVRFAGQEVAVCQWASPIPVAPLASIAVGPEDFPLLGAIRGHDDATTFARARANPDGFPWLDEA